MPHCIIEHSSNIEGNKLLPLIYSSALESKLFDPEGKAIKVRAIAYSDYQLGDGLLNFIHVTLKILSGRSENQKLKLSHLVLKNIKSLSFTDCSISVEVVDMDRDSYAKTVV